MEANYYDYSSKYCYNCLKITATIVVIFVAQLFLFSSQIIFQYSLKLVLFFELIESSIIIIVILIITIIVARNIVTIVGK